jgi:hypothetical protein
MQRATRWGRTAAVATMTVVAMTVAGRGAWSASTPPDFSGEWRIDLDRSTSPGARPGSGGGFRRGPRMGGGGMGGGGMGMGMRHGGGGMRDGERREGEANPRRMPRLPEVLRVARSEAGLTLSDSTGVELLEIRTEKPESSESMAVGIPRFEGKWHGAKLEATQTNADGPHITQTWALEKDGALAIKTRIEPGNGRPSREFTRVYRKAAAS